ncbi:MAG: hypothetical protein J6Z49_00965 [Kiritimatiellae bacterium]|nr:hypothetical protein [Kiritimatiellia bacterium]
MKVNGCNVLVLGAGVSGESAAELLLQEGASVVVADGAAPEKTGDTIKKLNKLGAHTVFGDGERLPDGAFDFAVASPAFAPSHPWLAACRERGLEVLSELELGARFWRGRMLAVTGSKGKSSIVKLLSDTLNLAGHSASPAGNYGIPLCALCNEQPELEWAVVEVSSFQMEHTWTFHPEGAALLNIQADHLDRHGGMAAYKELKLKLFSAMRPGALAALPERVAAWSAVPDDIETCRFGISSGADWRYAPGRIEGPGGGISLAGSWFDNPIFGVSASAAAALLRHAGLTGGEIEAGLRAFKPLAHRMQRIGTTGTGVVYIDDSKATSLTATAAAIQMVGGPVRLIAGGQLKETNVNCLKEVLANSVKKVYLIGCCAQLLAEAWSDAVPCEVCGTMERAVARAAVEATRGETVLLSPGTASFDQFTGYRERGKRFADCARAVAGFQEAVFPSDGKDKR